MSMTGSASSLLRCCLSFYFSVFKNVWVDSFESLTPIFCGNGEKPWMSVSMRQACKIPKTETRCTVLYTYCWLRDSIEKLNILLLFMLNIFHVGYGLDIQKPSQCLYLYAISNDTWLFRVQKTTLQNKCRFYTEINLLLIMTYGKGHYCPGQRLNSVRPRDAYILQWTGASIRWVLACHTSILSAISFKH